MWWFITWLPWLGLIMIASNIARPNTFTLFNWQTWAFVGLLVLLEVLNSLEEEYRK
jgi:hypothetical protein